MSILIIQLHTPLQMMTDTDHVIWSLLDSCLIGNHICIFFPISLERNIIKAS